MRTEKDINAEIAKLTVAMLEHIDGFEELRESGEYKLCALQNELRVVQSDGISIERLAEIYAHQPKGANRE